MSVAKFASRHDFQPLGNCQFANLTSRNPWRTGGARHALVDDVVSTDSNIDDLCEKIIGCAIEVHRILGPGLLESVYQECLVLELRRQKLSVKTEQRVPFEYKGERIKSRLTLDLVVENTIIVELKAVERLHPIHQAQVITYLKLTGLPAGLLINFNEPTLKAGLKRLDHPNRYLQKARGEEPGEQKDPTRQEDPEKYSS